MGELYGMRIMPQQRVFLKKEFIGALFISAKTGKQQDV